jgi:hypothetical protein
MYEAGVSTGSLVYLYREWLQSALLSGGTITVLIEILCGFSCHAEAEIIHADDIFVPIL